MLFPFKKPSSKWNFAAKSRKNERKKKTKNRKRRERERKVETLCAFLSLPWLEREKEREEKR